MPHRSIALHKGAGDIVRPIARLRVIPVPRRVAVGRTALLWRTCAALPGPIAVAVAGAIAVAIRAALALRLLGLGRTVAATGAAFGALVVADALHHFLARGLGGRHHDFAAGRLAGAAPDGLATHGDGLA